MLHDAISRTAQLDDRIEAIRRDYDAQPRRRRATVQRPAAQSPGRTGDGAQCFGLTLAATTPGQARSRVGA